jgi:uncharacterized protein (DUF1697 family)
VSRLLALLGSINIGGNRVKMVALKEAFAKEGFKDLVTVAASGNLILTDERDPAFIETHLERILANSFGFKSCVMVRDKAQVQAAIDDNPFHGIGPNHGSDKMVHSIFLSQQPEQSRFDDLLSEHQDKGSERLALGDRVLYLDYVYGVGVSDLSNKLLERRLGCKGTARNMNSLKNILAKMD